MKGSKWSVRQRDKTDQCIINFASPRGYITTVRSIRHYSNGMEVGKTIDGNRVVRASYKHVWFESINRSNCNGTA